MAYLLDRPTDQRSTYPAISWDQFKLIEQGFSQSPGIRLFYFKGLLETVTVSPEHEIFSRIIGFLIQLFLTELDVAFEPTGAMTQEKVGEASVQADESGASQDGPTQKYVGRDCCQDKHSGGEE
jgi:hypothetical protein